MSVSAAVLAPNHWYVQPLPGPPRQDLQPCLILTDKSGAHWQTTTRAVLSLQCDDCPLPTFSSGFVSVRYALVIRMRIFNRKGHSALRSLRLRCPLQIAYTPARQSLKRSGGPARHGTPTSNPRGKGGEVGGNAAEKIGVSRISAQHQALADSSLETLRARAAVSSLLCTSHDMSTFVGLRHH
jgi:hypothetical protein